MTAPVDLPQLTARIEQTIHRINNHWWNKRARPAAPDLRVLLDSHAALIAELTAARERLAGLEREMARRDANENRHCQNYAPCSRLDGPVNADERISYD